jgi:CheY-like chemotaxis protein
MASRKPTVLIAEDDPNDVFFLRRAFEKAGVDCQLCDVSDGQKAVEYLRGSPPYNDRDLYPVPDLLILDLKMPMLDGFAVLEWLAARPDLAHVPAVVLSSSSSDEDRRRAARMGAREYHLKPSEVNRLTDLASSLHSRWLSNSRS